MAASVQTLTGLFYACVDTHDKRDLLRRKRDGTWRDISSGEVRGAVEALSMGLRSLGLAPGDRVAILSENRPEWVYADLGTLCAGGVVVPVYPTLTAPQVHSLLNDSEARVAVVSTAAQAQKLAGARDRLPRLEQVVSVDGPPLPGTLGLDELLARGRQALAADPGAVRSRAGEARPDDVATIIYTSGTTGEPKGVMLTHGNLASNVEAAARVFELTAADVALSFLPLCHVFERMAGYYLMLSRGVTVAFAENVEQVPANMLEVRPTVMCSVPRLYEKMYARIHEKVAADPPLRRRLFAWAVGVGRELARRQRARSQPGPLLRLQGLVADRLVFSRIRARTGGRLRIFVSGGAPLGREIAEFFGAVNVLILEGYGLTETSPVITVTRPDDLRPGTVGKPVHGVEVHIAPDGEILTRGPHVMKGYFRKPEATAEVLDADGWFHTGDIGVLDEEGNLVITDRKKDIIVTSGGKNIAPQPIENAVKANPLVAEVVMVGNGRHFPAALVVPSFPGLTAWAAERGIASGDRGELVRHPEVMALYQGVVEEAGRDLAQFERIKRIALLDRELTLEAGELTPTLKVRRRVVEQRFKDLIDRMYENEP